MKKKEEKKSIKNEFPYIGFSIYKFYELFKGSDKINQTLLIIMLISDLSTISCYIIWIRVAKKGNLRYLTILEYTTSIIFTINYICSINIIIQYFELEINTNHSTTIGLNSPFSSSSLPPPPPRSSSTSNTTSLPPPPTSYNSPINNNQIQELELNYSLMIMKLFINDGFSIILDNSLSIVFVTIFYRTWQPKLIQGLVIQIYSVIKIYAADQEGIHSINNGYQIDNNMHGYLILRGMAQCIFVAILILAFECIKVNLYVELKDKYKKDDICTDILDTIPQSIILISAEGNIKYINKHFRLYAEENKLYDDILTNALEKKSIEESILTLFQDINLRSTNIKDYNRDNTNYYFQYNNNNNNQDHHHHHQQQLLHHSLSVKGYIGGNKTYNKHENQMSSDDEQFDGLGNSPKNNIIYTDWLQLKDTINELKDLSQVLKYLHLNKDKLIGKFKNNDFVIDCKYNHKLYPRKRSLEVTIQFSIPSSSSNDQSSPSLIVILNDTTERDIIAALESDNMFKDNLLASVSHELRTPLNGASNLLEVAISSQEMNNTIAQNLLIPAQNCCQLLKWVIDDILDLALINAKKFALKSEYKDIIETLRYCVNLLQGKAKQKGLEIYENFIDLKSLFIRTDHNRLSQILINLLNNSIKYSEQGKIYVKIKHFKSFLSISVKDEGIGITPLSEQKIKSMFTHNQMRLDKVNLHSSGAGIGLFISNHHAQQLNGKKGLNFKTEVNKGTKFWFHIPHTGSETSIMTNEVSKTIKSNNNNADDIITTKSKLNHNILRSTLRTMNNGIENLQIELVSIGSNQHEENEKLTSSICDDIEVSSKMEHYNNTFILPSKITSGNITPIQKTPRSACDCAQILIVDDDPVNVYSLGVILKKLNYTYSSAYNGQTAVDTILKRSKIQCPKSICTNFKLIIMDCNMPIMNGFEATYAIKKKYLEGDLPYIPIIGLTAYVDELTKIYCQECGMERCLNKPLNQEKFKEILNQYFS